jgi:hypothetical protein
MRKTASSWSGKHRAFTHSAVFPAPTCVGANTQARRRFRGAGFARNRSGLSGKSWKTGQREVLRHASRSGIDYRPRLQLRKSRAAGAAHAVGWNRAQCHARCRAAQNHRRWRTRYGKITTDPSVSKHSDACGDQSPDRVHACDCRPAPRCTTNQLGFGNGRASSAGTPPNRDLALTLVRTFGDRFVSLISG